MLCRNVFFEIYVVGGFLEAVLLVESIGGGSAAGFQHDGMYVVLGGVFFDFPQKAGADASALFVGAHAQIVYAILISFKPVNEPAQCDCDERLAFIQTQREGIVVACEIVDVADELCMIVPVVAPGFAEKASSMRRPISVCWCILSLYSRSVVIKNSFPNKKPHKDSLVR